MKIALAHDSLTQFGGAERMLQGLHEMYPDAPVFTLVYDKKLQDHFEGWQIVSSPLQYLYNLLPRLQYLLPLIPMSLRFFDFSEFDVVISSSSVFMKGITVPRGTVHINYCHTPARFLWIETDSYIEKELPMVLKPFGFLIRAYLRWMRGWDFRAAQRVDFFLTNSHNTAQRIKKFYNRDSEIIYPFVDSAEYFPDHPKENYYLAGGRLQAHKRVDLVIEAFAKLGEQLHVVGTGRAEQELRDLAAFVANSAEGHGSGERVHFLGHLPDDGLRAEYSGARALLFPQEEDFGIMPLEAMSCGTPVIAYGVGGALESVTPKTGVLFTAQTADAIVAAVHEFEQKQFLSEDLFARAEQFSKEKFQRAIAHFVLAHSESKLNANAPRN